MTIKEVYKNVLKSQEKTGLTCVMIVFNFQNLLEEHCSSICKPCPFIKNSSLCHELENIYTRQNFLRFIIGKFPTLLLREDK